MGFEVRGPEINKKAESGPWEPFRFFINLLPLSLFLLISGNVNNTMFNKEKRSLLNIEPFFFTYFIT